MEIAMTSLLLQKRQSRNINLLFETFLLFFICIELTFFMEICKVILFDIATIFTPKIMQWTKEHDDLLVKEVLALDLYSSPKGSTERSYVWDSIAGHLNACSHVKFAVSGRSVKDRLQLVLIRNYKRKISDEIRASGIEFDGLSDFETAMEEIAEKFDTLEKEKEEKQAEEIRNPSLERI